MVVGIGLHGLRYLVHVDNVIDVGASATLLHAVLTFYQVVVENNGGVGGGLIGIVAHIVVGRM